MTTNSHDLIRFLQERDARRKRAWTIGGSIAAAVVVIGSIVGYAVKQNIDEQNESEQRAHDLTCAFLGEDDC